MIQVIIRHPPRGGCWLKYCQSVLNAEIGRVTLREEGVG